MPPGCGDCRAIIGTLGAFVGNWLLPKLGIHLGLGIVEALITPPSAR
jgi:hypothetical protein